MKKISINSTELYRLLLDNPTNRYFLDCKALIELDPEFKAWLANQDGDAIIDIWVKPTPPANQVHDGIEYKLVPV